MHCVRLSLLLLLLPLPAYAAEQPTGQNQASRPEGAAQLRGPVHEAFAQPMEGAETPGAKVTKPPAASAPEMPQTVKPAVTDAVWIPGYWGWDLASKEFVWVSGIWRAPPPGRRWLPGYWNDVGDGWRWVRGFWAPREQPRLQYLAAPPPLPKAEPELVTADDGQFAVAGYWSHAGGQYVWNRGFQARHKPGWVWTPSHYEWTPAGSLFLSGYWDHSLDRRGLLMAPVPAAVGSSSRGVAVNLAELPEALFRSASHGHYYFGDYFGSPPNSEAMRPWYEPDAARRADPIFAYERWRRKRLDANWADALAERYQRRRDHAELRPPLRYVHRPPEVDRPNAALTELGVSLHDLAQSRGAPMSLMEIAPESLPRVAQNAERLRLLSIQRMKFESSADASRQDSSLAFYLPPPADPVVNVQPAERPRGAVAGEYVPGVAGRRVPGAGGQTPGVSGRTLPGVTAPAIGAGLPPDPSLTPRRPRR